MASVKTVYVCSSCSAQAPKWSGQCQSCENWNTLEVTRLDPTPPAKKRFSGYAGEVQSVQLLNEIEHLEQTRINTNISELDRALGGGLVAGSVVLIGGDPGIGKSTLLLQCLMAISANFPALYITGEESLNQVRLRADRLSLPPTSLQLYAETQVEQIIQTCVKQQPKVIVVDSIQTVYTAELGSAPGSVAQLRESTAQLVKFAKHTDTTIFLVGHVTKEGVIAGPRVLEHMVDTVLYFEGEQGSRYRILRAVKNRFGEINELGIFAMTETGLKVVNNPSALFLSRHEIPVPGSVNMVTKEGTRPLLLELQALVDENHGPAVKRVTLGLEQNRLAMLLAVLHRHGGVPMHGYDVFVNVVGGVRINETATDLAVIFAVVSSLRNRPISTDLVVFGEIGLAGEIRPVPSGEQRAQEAVNQGFKKVILPKANAPRQTIAHLEVIAVSRLSEALEHL